MLRPGAEAHHTGTLTDLLATLAGVESTVWLVGETDEALCDAFKAQSHVHVFDPISGLRRAGQLARLACRHIAAGTHDELHLLQPLYLRSP